MFILNERKCYLFIAYLFAWWLGLGYKTNVLLHWKSPLRLSHLPFLVIYDIIK